jgi:phosphomannomutase
VRGVALAGVPGEPVTLTPLLAFHLGAAFAAALADRAGRPPASIRVATGRDPRLSGPALDAAFCAGVASAGASAVRFGLATTPAMFHACVAAPDADTAGDAAAAAGPVDGGVMVTASHLPWNRQGFKFFTPAGGYDKPDVADVLARAAALHADTAAADPSLAASVDAPLPDGGDAVVAAALAAPPGAVAAVDFMPTYCAHLRRIIVDGVGGTNPKPLAGLRIAVDAGNGGGGFLATSVLAPLGADVSGSQYLDPDGRFPNHAPNPEDRGAMRAAVAMTRAARAHLGIILDTDVDRSAVVSATGDPVNGNRYIALLAGAALAAHPGATIVTDSVTSDGLAEFIAAAGGTHLRFKRGYRNVIRKCMELNDAGVDCPLAMETSGHGASRDNAFLDDGTYSASQVVILLARAAAAGGSLDVAASALAGLAEPADSVEIRLKVGGADSKATSASVLAAFHDWVAGGEAGPAWQLEEVNHEGWRVRVAEEGGGRGWALLRGSLHDPLLVLNAESSLAHGTCAIVGRVLEFFEGRADKGEVDIDALYDGASACTIQVR